MRSFTFSYFNPLTNIDHRSQSTDLHSKSIKCFLYERDIGRERANHICIILLDKLKLCEEDRSVNFLHVEYCKIVSQESTYMD